MNQLIPYPKCQFLSVLIILLVGMIPEACRQGNRSGENKPLLTAEIVKHSLDAIGTPSDRQQVKNLVSMADCEAPQGPYTTEVHTAQGGYSYFKQVYSYRPEAFEAITNSPHRGLQIQDSLEPLSREAIYTIRSHQFQNLVMELDHRFHDFRDPKLKESRAGSFIELNAKDELNHDCTLIFEKETGRISELDIINPDDRSETIKIRFFDWRPVQELTLPFRVRINQSGKLYRFNYSRIDINSPGFQMKKAKDN